jgi:polyisoprenoid-binding protein YceI
MMSKVRGTFRTFSGTIVRDEADFAKSSVELRIDAASIDTRHESRDEDLRGADFFDVEKFPEITFKSTAVQKVSDNAINVTGELTMHGVTRTVTLPVMFQGELKDARGNLRAGFSVDTRIDRKEYGITWNRALDSGGYLLSDEVEISINVEAKEQPAQPPQP